MTYYKWLTKDVKSPYANWQWPAIGEWTPYVERLEICDSGYHASEPKDLIAHTNGIDDLVCYEVEFAGDVLVGDDKVTGHSARLIRGVGEMDARKWRLLACDCAERALHIYESEYPDDKRPRQAIEVARRYANGKATIEELTAASDAASDAAWAAWAASDAARAAWAASDARAAWAAWAEWAAAKAAERKWQGQRLLEYLAA